MASKYVFYYQNRKRETEKIQSLSKFINFFLKEKTTKGMVKDQKDNFYFLQHFKLKNELYGCPRSWKTKWKKPACIFTKDSSNIWRFMLLQVS